MWLIAIASTHNPQSVAVNIGSAIEPLPSTQEMLAFIPSTSYVGEKAREDRQKGRSGRKSSLTIMIIRGKVSRYILKTSL